MHSSNENKKNILHECQECYQFSWPGKSLSAQNATFPFQKKIQFCPQESVNFETTQNLYIEGDNLDALKFLKSSYLNKIKAIYIDPPYNTGNDFLYNDKFNMSQKDFSVANGQNDDFFLNGRAHSAWLNMIFPRLKIAKELLTQDGVIFISIDESEFCNLKLICNEIFGEKNFVNTFMWLHGKGKKDSWSRTLQQYILVYAKNKTELKPWFEKKSCKYNFKNPDNDPKGPWFSGSLSFSENRSNKNSEKYYSIESPSGKIWNRQWHISKEEMENLIKNGDVFFGRSPNYSQVPRRKIRPQKIIEVIPNNIIEDCNTSRGAQKYLSSLFGTNCFSYPKPYELIQKLLSLIDLKDSIVLDFFSGSATTAESVIRNNLEKNLNTRFIMVQIPEDLDKTFQNVNSGQKKIIENAINYLQENNKPHNICEIGKERIRLCCQKLAEENPKFADFDTGFKVLKIISAD